MKNNTTMILAIAVIAILVWYFFLKDKKDSKYTNYELDGGMLESSYKKPRKCKDGEKMCACGCCSASYLCKDCCEGGGLPPERSAKCPYGYFRCTTGCCPES